MLVEAIVLGIIQSLTEFLPVSSSGHLILFQNILGWKAGGQTFDVALHVGTFLALVIYFRKELIDIAWGMLVKSKKAERSFERKLGLLLVVGTIPGVVSGYFLEDITATVFRSNFLVAVMLMLGGLVLWAADKLADISQKKKKLGDLRIADSLTIGFSQALALVPGVSRSGITISTGLFLGLDRENAARFSFLLSIPIVFGAAVKKFLTDGASVIATDQITFFVVGILTSAITGYIVIKYFLNWLVRHGLMPFVYYRFVLAAVILIFLK